MPGHYGWMARMPPASRKVAVYGANGGLHSVIDQVVPVWPAMFGMGCTMCQNLA